jgi:protein TonB
MQEEAPSRLAAALAASVGAHAFILAVLGTLPPGQFAGPTALRGAPSITVVELYRRQALSGDQVVAGLLAETRADAPPAKVAAADISDSAHGAVDTLRGELGPRPEALAPVMPRLPYVPASELDARPGIMVQVMPGYPALAAAKKLSGSVVIRVFINERGEVDDVTVVRADPPGVFEDSAMTAFRAARFSPGVKAGEAVKSYVTLEVSYDAPAAR